MKLQEITIESFKSIENQKIILDYNCKGLIGLNESGKSNILSAIQCLDSDMNFTESDISKITNKLPKIKFHFSISNSTLGYIKRRVQFYLKPLLLDENENIFKDFELDSLTVIIEMVENEGKMLTIRTIDCSKNYKFCEDFLFVVDNEKIPDDKIISINEKNYILNKYRLFLASSLPEEILQEAINTDNIQFKNVFNEILQKVVLVNLPSVVFWEYDDKYLLPSEISYEDFMKNDNPYENSEPLANVFFLSERLNIKSITDLVERISKWKKNSSLRRKDSLILNEDLNTYIRNIWEYYDQDLSLDLEENIITIHINDPQSSQKNYYEMEARSQGFKTFISFILTIAVEFEDENADQSILLLDEPETHLHPSGVRYMRNELCKLAEKGHCVIFATHSIFMIDRSNLKRHYIIEKMNELTSIKPVEKNNITQESVIYQAMGTTVDEFSISNNNIMFEGETDLLMFESFIKYCLTHRQKEKSLDAYSLRDGGGTSKIEQFFKAKIIPKDSEWILILDYDRPGRELPAKLDSINSPQSYKLRYFHYSKNQDCELEDLLPQDIITAAVNTALQTIGLNISFILKKYEDKSISSIIDEFKGRNRIQSEQFNLFEKSYKDYILKNITDIVNDISKIGTIYDRLRSFQDRFPLYYEFVKPLLINFNIDLEKVARTKHNRRTAITVVAR